MPKQAEQGFWKVGEAAVVGGIAVAVEVLLLLLLLLLPLLLELHAGYR